MMRTLAGRTLLVTGATRGIGLAIAVRAARDGANVAILGKTEAPHPKLPGTIHDAARAVEEAGGRALALACDVRDEQAVARAVDATVGRFGGLDALVNNASAISLTGTLATPVKRFDLMTGVNVRGTFVASQACLPHLLAAARTRGEAHVLTLAPPPSLDPRHFRDHVAYAIAKVGMSLATLGMAEEFREQDVRVNALWPRTVIATAAIAMLPGADPRRMRTPQIVADAAHAVLSGALGATSGRFLIDEDVLRTAGLVREAKDLERYAVDPAQPLMPDLFLD